MKFFKRHILKTITWRLIGTTDTFIITSLISKDFTYGLKISLFEIFSKMILYYFHERFWFNSIVKNSDIRHLIKTFSWRFIATTDTVLISCLILGNIYGGLKIGIIESLSKIVLYYLHEKVWYLLPYGKNN